MNDKITFSFGKNWMNFIKNFDEDLLQEAEKSLTEFMGIKNLHGRTFLDIGCGSGLFSLAAHHLGAKQIVSFDADPFSFECCRHLKKQVGNPKNWEVIKGSALNDSFLLSLGTFDVVYSWGVLHHTGNMWEAIRKTAKMTNLGGYYYITIYNKVEGLFGSRYWLKIKKFYNSHPFIGRYIIEPAYVAAKFGIKPFKLQNPFAIIKRYSKRQRGMLWRRDITDWLGGYPYEFASVEDIFCFIKKHYPYFQLVNIRNSNFKRPNWFLFRNDG